MTKWPIIHYNSLVLTTMIVLALPLKVLSQDEPKGGLIAGWNIGGIADHELSSLSVTRTWFLGVSSVYTLSPYNRAVGAIRFNRKGADAPHDPYKLRLNYLDVSIEGQADFARSNMGGSYYISGGFWGGLCMWETYKEDSKLVEYESEISRYDYGFSVGVGKMFLPEEGYSGSMVGIRFVKSLNNINAFNDPPWKYAGLEFYLILVD